MRSDDGTAGQIGQVRMVLDQVRKLLLTPTPATLSRCCRPLEKAAAHLRRLKSQLEPLPENGDGAVRISEQVRNDIRLLERDLGDVRNLLRQAGAFYLGWSRILLSASSTYDASGEMTPLAGGRLSVRG